MVNGKIIEALTRPMVWEERAGPGKIKFRYVKGEDVIERLNEAFSHEWSSEVMSSTVEGDFVVILIRISVFLDSAKVMHKEAYGGASLMRNRSTKEIIDMSNTYKSAFTNALKKAAEQFGIGLKEGDSATVLIKKPYENNKPYENKPGDNTATGSVVVETKKPVTNAPTDLERAKAMMAELERTASEPSPFSEPWPGHDSPKEEKPSGSFPKSTSNTDPASDLQKGAIIKLANTSDFSIAEIIKLASEDKKLAEKLGNSLSGKSTEDELTKTEAAVIIRFISSKNAGN